MKNLWLKVQTGYNTSVSIPAEEAHKAYYLFVNPDERTIFSNGVALIGRHIMGIEPDYNKTMGWNEAHKLTTEDFKEIYRKGIDTSLKNVMEKANAVSKMAISNSEILTLKISEISEPKRISSDGYYRNFML